MLGGAATAAATLPFNVLAQTPTSARQSEKFPPSAWHQRLKRIMQVNLTEGRIPFDVVLGDDLSAETLQRYSVFILSNMALMSDTQKSQIVAFVTRDGSLHATFETGLYDENGGERLDFALAELPM